MKQIVQIILLCSISTVTASFNWNTLIGKTVKSYQDEVYKLQSLSSENGSFAIFKAYREGIFKDYSIKILLLREDEDDTKIHELIQDTYKILIQQSHIYVYLCLYAYVKTNVPIAFMVFDSVLNFKNLTELPNLDNTNLTGAKVWDYVNHVTHPNEIDQLFEFTLERHIPTKPSSFVEGAFYLAKVHRIKSNTIKNISAVVIVPLQVNNTEFIEREFARLQEIRGKTQPFKQRFGKNGYINGRLTPFLAVELGSGNFNNSLIDGLISSYVAYTVFIDSDIILTEWERIRIDDKPISSYFDRVHLTDYSQNTTVDWGLFKSTIIPNNSSDPRGPVDVDVRVQYLPRISKDTELLRQYNEMFLEKDKYEFLCYCDEALILKKRVAFLAFKPLERSENNRRNSAKRKSDTLFDFSQPKLKKRTTNEC